MFEADRATPMNALVISLAGPAASLVGALATAVLAICAVGPTLLTYVFVLATFEGAYLCFGNLRPTGEPEDPFSCSDGRWAQLAIAALREGDWSTTDTWVDPHTETSFAPPAPRR